MKNCGNDHGIPTCNILGVNVAAINMEWILSFLRDKVRSADGNGLAGDYICITSVHSVVMSWENTDYRDIQNSGLMATPDGGPLSTLGRKRGYKDMRRVCGPDLMGEIFKISSEYGFKHYFYGSTDDTLQKLVIQLKKNYSGIDIVGMYSPPFRAMSEQEDAEAVKSINETSPDFIWVGLGAPKQEIWMAQHKGKVNGLMIGVGAGFDYFAGKLKRAPLWMQRSSLEWFYRLIQEPRRLFFRYLKTNSKFIWLTLIRRKQ
jgi:N-acetylglucosaminyldiphosphoundecaprenol N-acetyl-beta-D-mannosaminyltransferase